MGTVWVSGPQYKSFCSADLLLFICPVEGDLLWTVHLAALFQSHWDCGWVPGGHLCWSPVEAKDLSIVWVPVPQPLGVSFHVYGWVTQKGWWITTGFTLKASGALLEISAQHWWSCAPCASPTLVCPVSHCVFCLSAATLNPFSLNTLRGTCSWAINSVVVKPSHGLSWARSLAVTNLKRHEQRFDFEPVCWGCWLFISLYLGISTELR